MQAKRSRCEAGGSSSAPGSSSVPGSTLAQAIGEARTQLDSVFNPLLGADGLLEQLRAKLGEQCQVAEQEAGEQQDALSQQKQSLQREVELMEHAAGQLKEVVKLNIGGTLFRTSRATLTATPSMLATMFSGRHAVPTDDDGSVFIDRDGRHFHHVLNYLRTGSAVLPQADDAQQELLVEADYYQLGGLIEALSGKGRFERQLGPLNVALRDREDEVRRLFAQEPTSPLLADQHLALLDVFADLQAFSPAADETWQQLRAAIVCKRRPLPIWTGAIFDGAVHTEADPVGRALLCTLNAMRCWLPLVERKEVPRSVCQSLTQFQQTFSRLSSGVLEFFDMAGMVVAGGAVLAALMFQPLPAAGTTASPSAAKASKQRHKYFESRGFNECDIDMFLVGLSANEANDRIRALYEHLRTFGDTTVVRTKCAITFMQEFPHRVIQVILRLYKSPAEILAGFDVDACCVAYDGERVWASQRARRALNGMVNVADPSRQSTTYESRLWKYAVRGFAVAVPGFDAYKVGEHLHECEIGDVRGMAKLLLLERLTDERSAYNSSSFTNRRGRLASVKDGLVKPHPLILSPYNAGTHRRAREHHVVSGIADPADSDYAGFQAKVPPGKHPFGIVGLFIQGALKAHLVGGPMVPCVAARNSIDVIFDAGGEERIVTMVAWKEALEHVMFGSQYIRMDDTRVPDNEPHVLEDAEVSFTPSVTRRIEYVEHDAGRQMIGSFHPVDGDWFADAYNPPPPKLDLSRSV